MRILRRCLRWAGICVGATLVAFLLIRWTPQVVIRLQQHRVDQVALGASAREVRHLLGPPDEVYASHQPDESLQYVYRVYTFPHKHTRTSWWISFNKDGAVANVHRDDNGC